MPSELVLGRARSDIDVMSRAGLPLHTFLDEASAVVERVLPIAGGCLATLDPATAMVSSHRKFSGLTGHNEADVQWARIEYGEDEPTAFQTLVRTGSSPVGMHEWTQGDVSASTRMAEIMIPYYDFHDEARTVLRDRHGAWGAIAVFRGSDDAPFDAAELSFLEDVAPSFTRGIRIGMLAQVSAARAVQSHGPSVVIVDGDDRLVQASAGAAAHLEQMASNPGAGDPLSLVHELVPAARRLARGQIDQTPRVRIRTREGIWLVLHASPLGGAGERAGDVVVTIEEARPQEVIGLVADAFGLTARERDVTAHVLRGADTKEIAAAMHVSPYTVQDHLKSIFEKASVASRRELVSRVYFDQYMPRQGDDVRMDGFFAA
ncbi:LuxR C-terminal-related transcriptional regulator [Demequina capsici]|uniref:LuxR C-terminal-related transcriptional regulator n=1 Tax=Demequina capsici TaxID=3075620 RepID=A0AA96FFQ2_9MICO|nr:LuxR C-terminal-related transcriptional regulator [Demequina sp. PMTSA13]WNM27620.1 LuxR C-terminal-related transcriptional regulator [Demequina sp. PMTSA13]